MTTDIKIGMLVVAAIVMYKLIDKAIDYFWKRTAGSEYLTREQLKQECEACHKNNNTAAVYTELSEDIKQVKEILLLVALKIPGIEHNDLKGLVQ